MNIFETVKLNTDMASVAERYGSIIGKNRFTNCIFHNDKHPSMKLYKDHYHCFSCGAHGDVVSFIAQRFGLSQYDAVTKITSDFRINNYGKQVNIHRYNSKDTTDELIILLSQFIKVLEQIRDKYSPCAPAEILHPLYVSSVKQLPTYQYYLDILTIGSEEERKEFSLRERRKLLYGLRKLFRQTGMAV